MSTEILDTAKKLLLWRKYPIEFYKEVAPSMTLRRDLRPIHNHEIFLNGMADLSIDQALLTAARSTGKTLCMACLTLWSVYVLPYFLKVPYRVSILSGSLEQSKVLYEYISRGIRSHSFFLDQVDGGREAVTKTYTPFLNGSWIKAMPASEQTVLSQHCDLLIVDEAGSKQLADGKLIEDSMPLISPSPYPRSIWGTTPYDFNSYYVEHWEDKKLYPDSEWRRYGYWTAADCYWIKESQIEKARRSLSAEKFAIQWLGVPTAISGTWIDHADLSACLVRGPENKPVRGEGIIVWGIDYGYRDPTCLVVVQIHGGKAVVLYIQGWEEAKFDDIQKDLMLLATTEYPPNLVYADRSHIGENQRLVQKGLTVKEIVFRNDKGILQHNLRAMFQKRDITVWDGFVPLVQQLLKYTETTKKGEDYVDALMMALKKTVKKSSSLEGWADVNKPTPANIRSAFRESLEIPSDPDTWED